MHIGNMELFLESITNASACNKLLRKRFMQPDTIGLIPTGAYTCNTKYSKNALIWLLHTQQTDVVKIMHGRNGREYRLPELPRFSVDGYCPETRTIYEFFGCDYNGNTCQPFDDVTTMSGDTLSERYKRTMSRFEQITRAGYLVKIQWECEFVDAGRPKLLVHPIVKQSPLCTRDVLYVGRIEAMSLHYKARHNETIQ
jgi:G:T-mismatch repair DNA endonuclease (very short patch repair protein)